MSNKPYKQYRIGDVVKIASRLDKSTAGHKRVWKQRELHDSTYGFYVGWTLKFNGKVEYDGDGFSSFDHSDEPPLMVARVRLHSRGKEMWATFDRIEKAENVDPDQEFFRLDKTHWGVKYKEDLRKLAYDAKCPYCGKFTGMKRVEVDGKKKFINVCQCGWEELHLD